MTHQTRPDHQQASNDHPGRTGVQFSSRKAQGDGQLDEQQRHGDRPVAVAVRIGEGLSVRQRCPEAGGGHEPVAVRPHRPLLEQTEAGRRHHHRRQHRNDTVARRELLAHHQKIQDEGEMRTVADHQDQRAHGPLRVGEGDEVRQIQKGWIHGRALRRWHCGRQSGWGPVGTG